MSQNSKKSQDRQFWLCAGSDGGPPTFGVVDFPASESVSASRAANQFLGDYGGWTVIRVAPLGSPDWTDTFDVKQELRRR